MNIRFISQPSCFRTSKRASWVLPRALAVVVCAVLGATPTRAQVGGTIRNVTSFGALPNDQIDDTLALKAALSALQPGDTLIFNQAGIYLVGKPLGTTVTDPILALANLPNVTIKAVAGVRIRLTGYDRGNTGKYPNLLHVSACDNFRLLGAGPTSPFIFDTRGASIPVPGNEGLPFLQGKVLSVTSTVTNPASGPNQARIRVTDPELFLPVACKPHNWGAWKIDAGRPDWAQYDGTVVPVGPPAGGQQDVDLLFSPQTYAQPFSHWQVGDDVVVTFNNSDTYAVTIWDCNGTVTARDLLARHLPGKWFSAGAIENLVVDNVDALPPSGRLISVDRDGINASAETLLVENCDVKLCGDDGIVSNGTSWGSVSPGSATATTFVVEPPGSINPWPTTASPGQLIVALDGNSLSTSTMQWAVVSGSSTTLGSNGYVITYTYSSSSTNFLLLLNTASSSHKIYTYNPSWSLNGATVQDCTVDGPRGLGVVVRSLNTLVQRCTISNTLEVGIHAGGGLVNAYPWWNAGAPPHNLAIDQCTLTRCGVPDSGLATRGAIEIAVAQSELYNPGMFPGGTWDPCLYWINPVYSGSNDVILNASVTHSTITDFPRAGIYAANVGGASGIQVRYNTIQNSGPADSCHPEYGAAVAVETCASGALQGNMFINCMASFWQHQSPGVQLLP